MQASSSNERTPLVQPTYMFESRPTGRFQKLLYHAQCAIFVCVIVVLSVAVLVTISYSLSHPFDDNLTDPNPPALPSPASKLTMTKLFPGIKPPPGYKGNVTSGAMPPALQPLLDLKWPLKETYMT